jgi:hypothetical protein
MNTDIINALENFKKSKRLLEIERMRLMAILPDDVASEFHYNGMHATHRYPEYTKVFEALQRDH